MKLQEKTKKRNPDQPQILNRPYRILGSGPGKTNVLLNLINYQPNIDKIFLYAKDTYDLKYQYLIKCEEVGFRHYEDPNAFIKYSNDMKSVYSIEKYNPGKEQKVLIVFDDIIADMISSEKTSSRSY